MEATGLGILFAIIAMLSWGVGDFLIQRSTRKIGDWETLFIICLFGVVILLPFVWNKLETVLSLPFETLLVLAVACVLLFGAALLEFEALKRGKISVVEPVWSLEIPSSAFLAFILLGEILTSVQIFLIIMLIIGLFLVSYKGELLGKKFFLEKGVILSMTSAVVMGGANFFVGWGGRETDPLVINFLISLFSMLGALIFILVRGSMRKTISDVVKSPKMLLSMAFLDNLAWVAFAFAMSMAPIGISVALSESYIILAVLLGLFIAREKLQNHQKKGLVIALLSAIVLGVISI